MKNKPPYNPTPEEIAIECENIRSDWSDATLNSRARPEWRRRSPEAVLVKLLGEKRKAIASVL